MVVEGAHFLDPANRNAGACFDTSGPTVPLTQAQLVANIRFYEEAIKDIDLALSGLLREKLSLDLSITFQRTSLSGTLSFKDGEEHPEVWEKLEKAFTRMREQHRDALVSKKQVENELIRVLKLSASQPASSSRVEIWSRQAQESRLASQLMGATVAELRARAILDDFALREGFVSLLALLEKRDAWELEVKLLEKTLTFYKKEFKKLEKLQEEEQGSEPRDSPRIGLQ